MPELTPLPGMAEILAQQATILQQLADNQAAAPEVLDRLDALGNQLTLLSGVVTAQGVQLDTIEAATVGAAPTAPTAAPTVTAGVSSISVAWTPDGYASRIYRSTTPTGTKVLRSDSGDVAEPPFADAATAGVTYYYFRTRVSPGGAESGFSPASAAVSSVVAVQPTVSGVSPGTAPVGFEVTLTGTGFLAGMTAKVGAVSMTGVVVNSPTSATATIGAGSTMGAVTVTTAGGTSTGGPTLTIGTTALASPVVSLNVKTDNGITINVGAVANSDSRTATIATVAAPGTILQTVPVPTGTLTAAFTGLNPSVAYRTSTVANGSGAFGNSPAATLDVTTNAAPAAYGLKFDGVDDYLTYSSFFIPGTMIVRVTKSLATDRVLLASGDPGIGSNFTQTSAPFGGTGSGSDAGTNPGDAYVAVAASGVNAATGLAAAANYTVASYRTSSTARLSINGAVVINDLSITNTAQHAEVGRRLVGGLYSNHNERWRAHFDSGTTFTTAQVDAMSNVNPTGTLTSAAISAALSAVNGGVSPTHVHIPGPTTCFQDSAGTTAAVVGQPVGRYPDLVGTRHLTQATSGSRPTLVQN